MAWHVGGKTSVFANGVAGLHAVDMLLIEAGGVIDKADGGTAGMVDLHPPPHTPPGPAGGRSAKVRYYPPGSGVLHHRRHLDD